MVRLFNICVENGVISCDYEPEKSQLFGHVSVSLDSKEVISTQYSDYAYGKKFYLSCVYAKLLQLLKTKNKIPTESYAICF